MASVLVSFASESLLTGPGAGGFMLLTSPTGRSHLLDFFVAAPGRGLADPQPAPLLPVEVAFSPETIQVFNVGASSCGAYGTPAGLAYALERYGTLGLGDLTPAAAKAARDGVEVSPIQEYLLRILGPIFRSTPEGTALYEPGGHPVVAGERLPMPELADLLDRLGAEGPGFLYDGDVAAAVSAWVLERGGLLTAQDLADYEVIERAPVGADFRDRRVLTNPPPSSGGILIADALELLDRIDRPGDTETLAEVIAATNRARDHEFVEGLRSTDFVQRFLAPGALDRVAGEIGSRLGSTTHISVMDADGGCATVTCSNGTSSGVVVPGTGMHLNNMMGEEDLNPGGFHEHPPGERVPSMMAPTVVVRDGQPEMALGSAGLEPDPLGHRADHRRGGGRRHGRPGRGGLAARARGGAAGGRRAGGGRERAGGAGASATGRSSAGTSATCTSAACRRWCATPRGASAAAATRAAAAWRSRSPSRTGGRSRRPESLTAGPMTTGRARGNLWSCPST